jgi:hypothetical protein
MKAQWACKKCKGKFETMASYKYHACTPKKFERAAPRKPKKRPAR